MVLSLPACDSTKVKSTKRPDRDTGDTQLHKPEFGDTVPTHKMPTETMTEGTTETINQIDITTSNTLESAYLQVLSQYEPYLKMIEEKYIDGQPSCSYVDITGDFIPELIIQYASDIRETENNGTYFVFADTKIFTYDSVSGEAVEMLHAPNTIMNAGSGFCSDVLLLNNGHILMTLGSFEDPSFTELWTNEYEVLGNSLVLVNSLYKRTFYNNFEDFTYEYVYTYNDEEISEEEYDDFLNEYIDSFSLVITRDLSYDFGYYSRDREEWAKAVMDLPDNSIKYDQLVEILGG